MKISLLRILIFILLILPGCINYEQVTIIKKDGSGEMYVHYWMNWKSEKDSAAICNAEIFFPDSINAEFSKPYIQIDYISVYKQPSDSSIHAKIEISYEHIDSLNQTEMFYLSRFTLIKGPDETQVFSQFVPPMMQGFGSDKTPRQLEYVYYLPGRIVNSNADEIDKNKLTWKLRSDHLGIGKFLTATYKPFRLKETPAWVYYSALFVFLIVVYFVFRRDK